jgi:hypothetical protein
LIKNPISIIIYRNIFNKKTRKFIKISEEGIMGKKPYILWFDEIGLGDIPLVGGKNASLGEMRRELTKQGVDVPNGFAVTVNAYHDLLEEYQRDINGSGC